MKLLTSEIVSRVLDRKTCIAMYVMRFKKHYFTVLGGDIWRKTEYSINTEITRTELVPTNKTKSTTNDMHLKRSDFLKFVYSETAFAWLT